MQLKESEKVIAQCELKEFVAVLTDSRLIITSLISEESFPLRGISGIGLYEDLEKQKQDIAIAKKANQTKIMGISCAIGFVLFLIFAANNQYIGGAAIMAVAVVVGIVASLSNPNIKVETILNIMQAGGSRQRFNKMDDNASDIKNFVQKVNETLF